MFSGAWTSTRSSSRGCAPRCRTFPTSQPRRRSRHGWNWPSSWPSRTSGEGSGRWRRGREAVAAGPDPASAEAAPIVDELVQAYAGLRGETDGPELRRWLADMIDTFADPRAERYWQLLAAINGWPPIPSSAPAWEWF